jgi:hypothetical protein
MWRVPGPPCKTIRGGWVAPASLPKILYHVSYVSVPITNGIVPSSDASEEPTAVGRELEVTVDMEMCGAWTQRTGRSGGDGCKRRRHLTYAICSSYLKGWILLRCDRIHSDLPFWETWVDRSRDSKGLPGATRRGHEDPVALAYVSPSTFHDTDRRDPRGVGTCLDRDRTSIPELRAASYSAT